MKLTKMGLMKRKRKIYLVAIQNKMRKMNKNKKNRNRKKMMRERNKMKKSYRRI